MGVRRQVIQHIGPRAKTCRKEEARKTGKEAATSGVGRRLVQRIGPRVKFSGKGEGGGGGKDMKEWHTDEDSGRSSRRQCEGN